MQFRGKSRLLNGIFEGTFCRFFKFPFLCTKIGYPFWQYRTTPHFPFTLDGSILVFVKEVINTMYDCNDLMEMQQRWGAEERKIVGGVKTLIQYLFRS